MELQLKTEGDEGVFYLEADGRLLGEMTFVFEGEDKIVIEHTEVKPGNEGKGLGKMLVQAGVDYARKNDYKIVPLCPYAKSVFDKTEAYKDVLFNN